MDWNQFWETLQLVLIFGNGFWISRLFIKTGLGERIGLFFIRKSKGHISFILFYILFLTSFLSLFIPNMIVLLALLPLLQALKEDIDKIEQEQNNSLITVLGLSALYGSNIGGMGSITGSIANMTLIGFLLMKKVAGTSQVNFLSWLGWGIPFIIVFSLVSGLFLVFLLLPKKMRSHRLESRLLFENRKIFPFEKEGAFFSTISLIFWLVISFIQGLVGKEYLVFFSLLALVFTLLVSYFILIKKFYNTLSGKKEPILTLRDCYSDLPIRGFVIIGLTIFISVVFMWLGIEKYVIDFLATHIPRDFPLFILIVILNALAIFASEIFSNTAVAIGFFVTSYSIALTFHFPALPLLLGVSLASTVPLMSPVGSPVNAMAYGGLKGMDLKKMLWSGFLMNCISVLLISLLVYFVIPWYYGL